MSQSGTAPYHVMREHCNLVAPRLWAEKGVGGAHLIEHEKHCATNIDLITQTLARTGLKRVNKKKETQW